MALTIEFIKDIETGSSPFISHEKDSTIYNYCIENEAAVDNEIVVDSNDYTIIELGEVARHLTTKATSGIGIKNFPGIGAIGFYRDAYSDECRVVAPIHATSNYYKAPMLVEAEIVDNQLHIVVMPPDDITYNCYRVVVRQSYFAFEYIMYKTDYYMDAPPVKGAYTVYCIGYDEANGTISHNSNELPLSVEEGSDSWAPAYDAMDEDLSVIYAKIAALENSIGDIGNIIDTINGIEV